MSRSIWFPTCLALTLAGCQLPGVLPASLRSEAGRPLPSPLETSQGQNIDSERSASGTVAGRSNRMGLLRLAVRWPDRTVQLIPDRVNTLRVEIRDAGGDRVLSRLLTRVASSSNTILSEAMPEGEGYEVRVDAFAEALPDSSSVVLARANALGVRVVWNREVGVPIKLEPMFVPHVESRVGVSAGKGAILRFRGANLDTGDSWLTFPSGQRVKGVMGPDGLEVRVPEDAGTGTMSLHVDRVPTSTFLPFRELIALGWLASNANDGIDRNRNGNVIETWPGDRFDLMRNGVDSAIEAVETPDLLTMDQASRSVGKLDASASYEVLALGQDELTLRSGDVVGTCSIVVRPPAGPTLNPRTPGDVATAVQDLSIVRVGDRHLAAWYVNGVGICWQFISASGDLDGPVHRYSVSGGFTDERIVRLAVSDRWIVMAVRLSSDPGINGIKQLVAVSVMDPATGELLQGNSGNPRLSAYIPGVVGNQRLDSLTAGRDSFILGLHTLNAGVQWQHEVLGFTVSATGDVRFQGGSLYPGASSSYTIKDWRSDQLAIVPDEGGFLYAQTFVHPEGSVVRKSRLTYQGIEATSSNIVDRMPDGRNLAIATADGGKSFLLAGIKVSDGASTIQTYRVSPDLLRIGNFQDIVSWNHEYPGALNDPVSLAWTGRQFMLAYVRRVPDPANPQALLQQPMIQALTPLGLPEGIPYAMAPVGKAAAIVPTAVGALAAWVDASGKLAIRHMRFLAPS